MKHYIWAVALFFAVPLCAQNTLTGTVVDDKNQLISNATVVIPELHQETTTNEKGVFKFHSLPKIKLQFYFSHIGYKIQNVFIAIKQGENQYHCVLETAIFQMDAVIVSTVFNKLQSQNVMKVEHQTKKALMQNGALTLVEGLATIPGVAQIETGTAIGKPVIRGLSGNRILVYSQGVRLENQQFGDEHGLGLNEAGIESVEVIKGPASLLYGSDALGGVVFFNPEKFAPANSFKTSLNQKLASNTLGSITSFGTKKSYSNFKVLAKATFATHSDYQIPTKQRVTNTRFNETDFVAGMGWYNHFSNTTLRYNFNKLNIGIPSAGVAEQSTSKNILFPRQAVDNHLLSLEENILFENSKINLNFGFGSNIRKEFEEAENPDLHLKLNTFNYDVKWHLPKVKNLESIIGLQGMKQSNTNFGTRLLIPNASVADFGIFGTTNLQWNKSALQAGLRFDNRNIATETHNQASAPDYFAAINKSYTSFNASIGYKINWNEKNSLRLNLASGFRAPNLAELTSNGVHEGTNRFEIGNANLKTEQNQQIDLNFEYKDSHFEFFSNAFYNNINHYIFTSPTGLEQDGVPVYEYMQSNSKLFGGEIGFHLHPHPLDWLHFESSFSTVTGQKHDGTFLPFIPANQWNNVFRTEFKNNNWLTDGFASLKIFTFFSQNKVAANETKSLDYTLFNIGFGGKIAINKMIFNCNISGNNIFNKTYISHLSRLKPEAISNSGRGVMLAIDFEL